MLRSILTRLIRASELSPAPLAIASIASVLLGWFQDLYEPILGPSAANVVSVAAFGLSFLLLLPIVVRDLNIWRLMPPKYEGAGTLTKYIGSDLGLSHSMFWGDDKRLRIDAARFLMWAEPLLTASEFVGHNEDRQRVCSEINVDAFKGTRYGLSYANKLERNKALAERSLPGLVLLRDRDDGRISLGLSITLPLTNQSAQAYTSGAVSDNEFNEGMLAVPGDEVGAIVYFLIAHDRRAGGRAAPSASRAKVLEQLLHVCLLQTVLIALSAPNQRRFLVIAANSNPKLKALFRRLQMIERNDLKSADQEDVFANTVHVRNQDAARKILRRRWPELADAILYAPAERPDWDRAA